MQDEKGSRSRPLPQIELRRRRLEQRRRFVAEQPALGRAAAAAGIAAELAARRHDAVAGDEDRQRVGAAALADRARIDVAAELLRKIAIGPRLAEGDGEQDRKSVV